MSKSFCFDLYERPELVVVVESFDGSIYQAFVQIDGVESLLWEDEQTALRTRSLLEMKEWLTRLGLPITAAYLRQNSAYDEMVGQPPRDGGNTLLLPLCLVSEFC